MTTQQVAGFPHSEISGSKPTDGSPKLIAVYRVLHRLFVSEHPPYTLSNFTKISLLKITQGIIIIGRLQSWLSATILIVTPLARFLSYYLFVKEQNRRAEARRLAIRR